MLVLLVAAAVDAISRRRSQTQLTESRDDVR